MISIIVPVYNTEKYLPSCLDSLIDQDVDKEILIIDDGSTDNSLSIAKSYEYKHSFIKVFHQANQGQSVARNKGIKEAKGDYLFFCDSDDYIEVDSLKELERLCIDNSLDVLKTGWETFDNSGKHFLNLPNKHMPLGKTITTIEYFTQSCKYWYNVIPWNGLVKKAHIIENNLFFSEGIQFEDNYFHLILMLSNLSARIMQINSCFYKARITPFSTTTAKPSPKKIYDQLKNIDLMESFINKREFDKELYKYSWSAISSLMFTLTNYYYRIDKQYRKQVYKDIPRRVLSLSIKYSFSAFQKTKICLFAYCRPALDVYERIRNRKRYV